MNSHIHTEIDGPIATLIIDRPDKRNAFDRQTAEELAAAVRAFEADPARRVAVLWGAHGVFCAGADLGAIGDPARRNELDPEGAGSGPMGITRMELSKPLIAAISGYAVAGGLELALCADLRVVEESAIFGVFCRRFGIPLIDGGTVRLPRVVGMGRALDMILTGRPVGAAEALAIGLATRVVPDGAARAEAEALARSIAAFPEACLRADRRSAYAQWDLPLVEALRQEGRLGVPIVASEGEAGALRFMAGEGRHGAFGGESSRGGGPAGEGAG